MKTSDIKYGKNKETDDEEEENVILMEEYEDDDFEATDGAEMQEKSHVIKGHLGRHSAPGKKQTIGAEGRIFQELFFL
ncbi:hypothetical protein AVEN_258870-1 [Araneus ventricosus]|uniref:Uncharacterized protein n=1 Tax=Araneus ventricosus TaxID=182803 RepID=A0A4Y2I8A0_ARAVE|nr:hypothetical protein AVEN_258870-1 [Araneus ventricosus]